MYVYKQVSGFYVIIYLIEINLGLELVAVIE